LVQTPQFAGLAVEQRNVFAATKRNSLHDKPPRRGRDRPTHYRWLAAPLVRLLTAELDSEQSADH
jgi:hypothetical protein